MHYVVNVTFTAHNAGETINSIRPGPTCAQQRVFTIELSESATLEQVGSADLRLAKRSAARGCLAKATNTTGGGQSQGDNKYNQYDGGQKTASQDAGDFAAA